MSKQEQLEKKALEAKATHASFVAAEAAYIKVRDELDELEEYIQEQAKVNDEH